MKYLSAESRPLNAPRTNAPCPNVPRPNAPRPDVLCLNAPRPVSRTCPTTRAKVKVKMTYTPHLAHTYIAQVYKLLD